MAGLLITIGLMIIGGAVAALLARLFKQPLLLGYVLAGAFLGPAMTGIISEAEPITILSELGLIFLMFVIGLELDLSKIKGLGKVSILIGFLQVFTVTSVITLLSLLGFNFLQSAYLGLLVSFSSTLVVVKILTDKKDLGSLHGELTLGVLVVQDVLAVLGLSLLGAFKDADVALPSAIPTLIDVVGMTGVRLPSSAWFSFIALLANGALFALAVYLFFRYLLPLVSRDTTSSSELLFISSLAAAFFIAAMAGFFQFSFAIGAFAAGIGLSSTESRFEIVGKVKPLKEFFLILFFVSLGLQVTPSGMLHNVFLVVFLLAGTLVLKPIVTFFILKLFRYNNRTAFLTSLELAQIGEFGMVIISSGVIAGAFHQEILTPVVITTVLTMLLAAYLIKYEERLFILSRPYIEQFEEYFGVRPEERRALPKRFQPEVIFFGVSPLTTDTIDILAKTKQLLIVDYNPERLKTYRTRGFQTLCTDMNNAEFYERTDFSQVELVVSGVSGSEETLMGPNPNIFMIKMVKKLRRDAIVVVIADDERLARRLYLHGATVVIAPRTISRRVLTTILTKRTPEELRKAGSNYKRELFRHSSSI